MNQLAYINAVLQGLMAFAALHYGYLWWRSRRERVLLVFAVYCVLSALVARAVMGINVASSISEAQDALRLRTMAAALLVPAVAWLVSEISGLRPRRFLVGVIVVCVTVSFLSWVGLPLNGTVTAVNRVTTWGIEVTLLDRTAAGWWGAPIYGVLWAATAFTVLAGWHLSRRDRVGGGMIVGAGLVTVVGMVLSTMVDVARWPVPYVANLTQASWVPVVALLLSREYARRADHQLATEARYRTLIDSAPEAIVVFDVASRRFMDCNPKAESLFGLPRSELMSKSPIDVSPPAQPDGRPSAEAAIGYIQEAVAGGTPTFEWIHRAKDGREFPCEIRLVRFPDPTRVLVRGSVTDITERKRAETALRDMQSRHTAILESSLDGLIVMNAQGRILEFNPAAEAIFLHRRQDVIGRDLAETLIPQPLRDAHRRGMERYLATGLRTVIGTRIEMPALRADGTEMRVELSIQPIEGTDPPLFAGVVRDITERLHLEDQLRQSQRMEAVGQLAGGVAHDFNNLLTVIAGYCGLLLDRLAPGDPLANDVKAIADAGQRAASLTGRLLAFSRQSVLTPKVVDINTLVADTEHILRRLIGEDILMTVAVDPEAGHVKVDPGHISQVLINLAINARDAMAGGGRLTIATSRAEVDTQAKDGAGLAPGPYVRLVVRDTGSGITPDVKSRMFEPFFTTKGVGKGTGLGLAVVHGIVKQSGGTIDVDSDVGVGTTFTIHLPLVEEAPSRPARPDEGAGSRGPETVLLVEDEDAVRNLLARALRAYGFTVLVAGDGAEALDCARRHEGRIDLLATDVVMPNMSGRELADRLRGERDDLKVLFVSGYTDDTLLKHGVYEAREAFLQKPFALPTLAAKVREVLDQR